MNDTLGKQLAKVFNKKEGEEILPPVELLAEEVIEILEKQEIKTIIPKIDKHHIEIQGNKILITIEGESRDGVNDGAKSHIFIEVEVEKKEDRAVIDCTVKTENNETIKEKLEERLPLEFKKLLGNSAKNLKTVVTIKSLNGETDKEVVKKYDGNGTIVEIATQNEILRFEDGELIEMEEAATDRSNFYDGSNTLIKSIFDDRTEYYLGPFAGKTELNNGEVIDTPSQEKEMQSELLKNIQVGVLISYNNKDYVVQELPNKENEEKYKITKVENSSTVYKITAQQLEQSLKDGKIKILLENNTQEEGTEKIKIEAKKVIEIEKFPVRVIREKIFEFFNSDEIKKLLGEEIKEVKKIPGGTSERISFSLRGPNSTEIKLNLRSNENTLYLSISSIQNRGLEKNELAILEKNLKEKVAQRLQEGMNSEVAKFSKKITEVKIINGEVKIYSEKDQQPIKTKTEKAPQENIREQELRERIEATRKELEGVNNQIAQLQKEIELEEQMSA